MLKYSSCTRVDKNLLIFLTERFYCTQNKYSTKAMPTDFINTDLPAANHISVYIYKNILPL